MSERIFFPAGSKRDWWDPSTLASFKNKTACMQQQYSDYYVQEVDMNVNGKLTLGENIADNGGMKINYLGYGERVNRAQEIKKCLVFYKMVLYVFVTNMLFALSQITRYTATTRWTPPSQA